MPKKLTQEEVIKRFKDIHGDRYDYSMVEFINTQTKVKIICKDHDVFEQTPNKHMFGQGCGRCVGHNKSNKDIISDFQKTHGDKYDYSLVEYKNNKTKVTIKCNEHGCFKQTPIAHINNQGCPKCGRIKTINSSSIDVNEFILRSNKKHCNKYDYSLVNYVNSKNKVKIVCPIHDVFEQSPALHIYGQGCPRCRNIKISKDRGLSPTGWDVSRWSEAANKSKFFDSFKVYIIKCWNDEEEFYKIGRTYLKTIKRFIPSKMPYNYEVIKEIILDNAKDCFDKETELKRLHKEYKYLPKIKFNGMHECFYKIDIRD